MPVTDDVRFDLDAHSAEFRDKNIELSDRLHAQPQAIGWSDSYDGFWVVGDWAACTAILEDWETFTSYNDLEGTVNGGKGVVIPQIPYRLDLSESDPPLHTDRRRLEAPFFTPRALREWRPVAQQHLDEAIDAVIESGQADLVNDIVLPTAARTTLRLLGYQLDWHDAADIAHKSSYIPFGDPGYPLEEMGRMREDFRAELAKRRADPTSDLISSLAHGVVAGEPLTDDQGESMMNALVFGGFDTAVSSSAHAIIWLSHHPEYIPRIREDADFRKNAVEEVLRFIPPTPGVARTATRDAEILGQRIRRGDRVYCWFGAANRDPKKFDDPNEIKLDRSNANEHLAFSGGVHRCLGSPLAKVELGIILETVFRRLPDLHVVVEQLQSYPDVASINGFIQVPVTFSPGERVLPSEQKSETV